MTDFFPDIPPIRVKKIGRPRKGEVSTVELRDVEMVTLTNGWVRWKCKTCGGLYDTQWSASHAYPEASGGSGNSHPCRSKPGGTNGN